jgi:hypothetical protein
MNSGLVFSLAKLSGLRTYFLTSGFLPLSWPRYISSLFSNSLALTFASPLKFSSRSYGDSCDEIWPGYTASNSLHTRPTSFEQYLLLVLAQQTMILYHIPCCVLALKIGMVDFPSKTIPLRVTWRIAHSCINFEWYGYLTNGCGGDITAWLG